MSKQRTPDGPAPKVYDTEKIIDIHSLESDPSFDSKKVREVKSYVAHSKSTFSSNDTIAQNENSSNPTWGIPTLAKFAHANTKKDVDVYDVRGKLD
ncbi:hypothetical protein psyc5s11_38710 [Clostridium gelidum]|uniref:Uncharacterized protein n=1 Tax=Clostridium gelidum TaxID=704125 RepID=A0ABN6J590_9CLOT|nr:hypothetical protein [Clostridium gelidum]BCZ47804.1 hypothetical protein psyc5s11_38710 [Clostridium gelidum]